MDRLTSMAVFAKVVEANSFSAAARTLGISQATASKHVQMLEAWLGVRLLNRTTRRIGMTAIGESFHAQCTRILDDIDEARNASKNQTNLRGPLRIAAPVCFGSTKLGPILRGFAQMHAAITLEVFLSDRAVDPLEEGFDVAIQLGTDQGPGLAVRRLAALPSVLCAAPAYLAGRHAPAAPEALEHHVCLLDRQLFPRGWRFVGSSGDSAPPLSYQVAANNALLLREAAADGAGVLLAPEFCVQAYLAEGRLVRLLPDWSAPPLELSAAFPAARQLSAKTREIVAYLADHAATA
ncbi:MAG: LysR family transcriptional regulator [Alphaproteobacteria bacterium]|nr:LysR family transcriptional regulator [Alphaproteobacteria bacterium]